MMIIQVKRSGRKPGMDISNFMQMVFVSQEEVEDCYGLRRGFIHDMKAGRRIDLKSGDIDKIGDYIDDCQAGFINLKQRQNDIKNSTGKEMND